ncbi:MAG: Sec-dependent nitrous-oxide reductase [Deltaproteobacteria bacterium]|nr:Sec-dependent nitrous-oxide reductase [Deltaproteobacteria bacterium]
MMILSRIRFILSGYLVLLCIATQSQASVLEDIAKKRGLTASDMRAALMTYTPSGKHDPYLMFASGGHAGSVLVIGLPSMRLIKTIPVFSPDSWQGWGTGSLDSKRILDGGGKALRWGDLHHPALSETNGVYDGQFLFVNDKANARVAVIDLRDFSTKQILQNPLFVNDHGGTFVTPNTEYIIETSQYNVPLGARYAPMTDYKKKYRGVVTFWKFDRAQGKINLSQSFSIELPPYWQDIVDLGKKVSDGYLFINSINTELASPDNMNQKPQLEMAVSRNDMDFLHVIDWKKAEKVAKSAGTQKTAGMKLITLKQAIQEKLLYFIHEPKSPHGVDVSPDGNYIVVSGKLDPHVTVFEFNKLKNAIAQNLVQGKDEYGVPILKFDSVLAAQIEVGLGPLHTQFDKQGYAYTSLFLDSAIAKWSLGEPYHKGNAAWKLLDKVSVHYNIGHLSCVEGDTAEPGEGYCVSLNKWAIDRFPNVGPLLPQNFQLVSTTGSEKMQVLYDMPIPNAEPHYAQIVKAERLKPWSVYPLGMSAETMKPSPVATLAGKERIVRKGNTVDVYMTTIRSHLTPDLINVKKGDLVRIHLSSIERALDATHGFAISRYNINVSLEPGKVETVEFKADQSGVFPYYCTEFCSALHLEMTGYLVVQ